MISKLKELSAVCPACGEQGLHDVNGSLQFEYKGQVTTLPQLFSECDCCGSDITTASQSKSNLRAANAFKKRVDGFLSGEDIRVFRKRYLLTQELCAQLFGGGEIAFSRYESDTVYHSLPMDRLIRLCIKAPKNLLVLAKESSVTLPDESIHLIKAEADKDFMSVVHQAFSALGRSAMSHASAGESANEEIFERYGAGEFKPRRKVFNVSEMIGVAA